MGDIVSRLGTTAPVIVAGLVLYFGFWGVSFAYQNRRDSMIGNRAIWASVAFISLLYVALVPFGSGTEALWSRVLSFLLLVGLGGLIAIDGKDAALQRRASEGSADSGGEA